MLQYTKQLHFMSVLVVLQLSKLFIIVFWNVHVLYTYVGMLNSKINIKKNPASIISMPQLVLTNTKSLFRNKLLLTYIIDTVGVHRGILHILLQACDTPPHV